MTLAEPVTLSVVVPARTPFPSVAETETDPAKVSTGFPEESWTSITDAAANTLRLAASSTPETKSSFVAAPKVRSMLADPERLESEATVAVRVFCS